MLLSDGQVFSFGKGDNGRLGHGDQQRQINPKAIPPQHLTVVGSDSHPEADEADAAGVVVQVCAGKGRHSMCASDAGQLFTFGYGWQGQLGHGSTQSQQIPRLVEWDF